MVMPAKRYTVRLYWRSSREAEESVRLDPRSSGALRAVLEDMVATHHGPEADDLSEYELVVQAPGNGRVHARCWVTLAGVTEVER
jgi:hypothetical protein